MSCRKISYLIRSASYLTQEALVSWSFAPTDVDTFPIGTVGEGLFFFLHLTSFWSALLFAFFVFLFLFGQPWVLFDASVVVEPVVAAVELVYPLSSSASEIGFVASVS